MQKSVKIVGKMSKRPVALTKVMQLAGILQILAQNFDGSYVCLIDLTKVDLKNSKANPRRHSKKHGNKIAKRWDIRCVTNPILRYYRGKLTTVDGRHRSFELLRQEQNIVTANIHFNITNAQAAAIFHDLTRNSKNILPWDAHACGLEAAFQWSVEIQTALEEYGLTSPNDIGCNKNKCDVSSYDPLHEAWANGDGVLDCLCHILTYCYLKDYTEYVDKPARGCEFLRGIIDMLQDKEYTGLSRQAIGKRLVRRTAFEIEEAASKYADEQGMTRPNRSHYYLAFVDAMELPTRKMAA